MNNIILCGFMGCGKSSVGRKLAHISGREFVDTDRYIEEKTGMTVAEIFEQKGEAGFRKIETEVCGELSERDNLIIAAGGGTLTIPENVEILRQGGKIVFLDVSYENLCERLSRDTRRPLLQVENRNEVIRELLDKRLPLYRKAASIHVNGNFNSSVVANNILNIIR